MKYFFTFYFFLLFTSISAQSKNEGEEAFHIDTVLISPFLNKLVFSYYKNSDGYVCGSEIKNARFEINTLDNYTPLQKDTIENIYYAYYDDYNFDNIKDLVIVTGVGMSGDNNGSDIYFYNTNNQLFDFAMGELSNPYPNQEDSTISTSHYCCMGRMGGSEVYKYCNGIFRKIYQSWYSESGSSAEELISDSLTLVQFSNIVELGNDKCVDSSWNYLYGKLRLVNVTIKTRLENQPTKEQETEGIAYQDVMGSFLFNSEEDFEYELNKSGKLICYRKYAFVKDGKWKYQKRKQVQIIQ